MKLLRKTKKSTLYFWVTLLSVALMCAQVVKLHVHSLDHDHDHDHNHNHQYENIVANPVIEHTHLSIAHLSADVSHADHHDEVISESDACPDCLLTKISNKVPFIIFVVLFMLVLFGLSRHTFNRGYKIVVYSFRQLHLVPPLRAPPC